MDSKEKNRQNCWNLFYKVHQDIRLIREVEKKNEETHEEYHSRGDSSFCEKYHRRAEGCQRKLESLSYLQCHLEIELGFEEAPYTKN